MSDFTSLVRPFQTRAVTPPAVVPSSDTAAPENVVLVIGKGGSAKTFTRSVSQTVTFYMLRQPKELTRKTHVKRVFNPTDSSQYVDVEVIDKIKFHDDADRGQETQYTLNNSDSGG